MSFNIALCCFLDAFYALCKALWIALLLKCATQINLPCLAMVKVKETKWHLTLSQDGLKWISWRENRVRKSTTLLSSTETEKGERRLIPVQPSLKTSHITRVHSKHMGDKLDSNSHLSISHLTGLFTCYINHLRTLGERRLSRHL